MKRRPSTSLTVAVLLVSFYLTPSHAADIRNVLEGYSITSWLQKDGLPPSVIWAVAQDKEGYLWLGTDVGPVRFDGVRFVVWQPSGPTAIPKAPVRAVQVARDGSIWLGFGEPGGVSRIRPDEVRNYGEADGLPGGAITMLAEDPTGDIWAGNREGLFRFVAERWESFSAGLPKAAVYRTYVDRQGVRFVATAEGLYRRAADQTGFHHVAGFAGNIRDVAEDGRGRVWIADPLVGFRRLDKSRTASPERGRGSRLLLDSKGNMWVGTFGQGLWRVGFDSDQRPVAVQRTTSVTGFSDDGVASLIEDRDGNIWVATYDGLNRLTPHKITPVMNLGVMSGVEETREGSVWVGTADALIEFPAGEIEPRREVQDFKGVPPSAMHADQLGALWVATERELLRVFGGRSTVVPLPGRHLQRINSITSDLKKRLWLADREQGVFRWSEHRLDRLELPTQVQNVQVMCSLGDRSGRVWLLFANGLVAQVDPEGKVVVYGKPEGLTGGVYRAIYEDREGVVWLGGNEGLTRFAGGAFTTMGLANGIPIGSIIAVMGDTAGALWLGLEGVGIVRINPEEIRKVVVDPAHQVRYSFYDKFDGFAGAPRWFGNSSTARGEDGRLWFVSARGVSIVDPRTIEESRPQPVRVGIEGILADGVHVPFPAQSRLPARTARIEIDYTVPNLAAPLKTRFRYRLEGFDTDWVEAGARRQAFYTNLPARRYRFRVIASNSDGTWTEPDVAWDFSISPKFYQTSWFLAACVGAVLVIPWVAWRLRIRQVRKQFSLLLGERARLSREVHDTLLQGLVGVALQCDAIANDVSSTTDTKDRLLQLRRDAEDYIRDARRSILDLRSPTLQSSDLASALRRAGERAVAGSHVTFQLTVTGTPSERWANAEEQLLRIGQEALVNAVRHAQATAVRIELHYNESSVVLRISDDGRGFDLDLVHEEEGHFGLLSMKERAEAVGGTLKIASALGRGAEVEAFVPIRQGS